MTDTIQMDGSYGEGGGQILRTALALSMVTAKPVEIAHIRRGRRKPGLQPQHLASVRAAQKISRAEVEGASLQSERISFRPQKSAAGQFTFDVAEVTGSAGATTLVLQTVLPILATQDSPSQMTLLGGTHVPWSPPAHYAKHVFAPMLAKLGTVVELELRRWGFYPKGGGEVNVLCTPRTTLPVPDFVDRGAIGRVWGVSAVAHLPRSIAERQRNAALKTMGKRAPLAEISIEEVSAASPGTFLFLCLESENIRAGFSALGERGKPAEKVGEEAAQQLIAYLQTDSALDPHLADQLALYFALFKGAAEWTTARVTSHLLTNLWAIEKFLPVRYRVEGIRGQPGKVFLEKA